MTALWSRVLVAIGALLVLGAVDSAIVGKERVRRDGQVAYLPLAPVDPRSLVQGDYMALRFALARQLQERDMQAGRTEREGEAGLVPVVLDERRVATLAGDGAPASLRLRYRIRGGQVWLGTNAFFFEEGTAQRFSGARYGEFRVDPRSGEAVLVGLRSDALGAL